MVETSTDDASHRVRRGFLGWDCESIRGETVESIPTPEASESERLPTPRSRRVERPEFLPISGWWSGGRMSFLSRIFGSPPLRLSQSLGAYPLPNGDISPLHVIFGVENTSGEEVEIVSVRVSPKGEDAPLAKGGVEGEVPTRIPAKESVRFEVLAKTLASASKNAGHAGTPRLSLVVTDGEGNEHRQDFRLRVDEYLALKDE